MISLAKRLLALLICFVTVSGSHPTVQNEYDLTDYYIEKLGLTIRLPSDAYITGRTVSPDYEPLEMFGMTASELEVQLKKGNIYCTALWFPEENDMTEIIVTMTQDDDSRAIFQLMDYDEFYLDSLAGSYAGYSEHGLNVNAAYNDASVVRTEQAAFIKANGVIVSGEAAEFHLHFMTVVNGQRIEITLVEHFFSDSAERPLSVRAENECLMNEIINSLAFDRIENETVAKNSSFVAGLIVISILSACLMAAYFISKYRAAKAITEAAEPTQDESCSDSEPNS